MRHKIVHQLLNFGERIEFAINHRPISPIRAMMKSKISFYCRIYMLLARRFDDSHTNDMVIKKKRILAIVGVSFVCFSLPFFMSTISDFVERRRRKQKHTRIKAGGFWHDFLKNFMPFAFLESQIEKKIRRIVRQKKKQLLILITTINVRHCFYIAQLMQISFIFVSCEFLLCYGKIQRNERWSC